MSDAHLAVIIKEIGQPDPLVPLGTEQQKIIGADLIRPVYNTLEFPTLPHCTDAPTLTLKPQPV
ncbi:hypothetical protein [Sulfitobacter sediminilitoris]|uniref:hypothetical protein n=1 Tax=Sulfitobacter sediminilitoris TaxID=2698830 RepID=UPI00360CB74A